MKNKIILYSTHCPQCVNVERLLRQKNIDYEEINDTGVMLSKGITLVPVLEVEGKLLQGKEIYDYLNGLN